MTFKEFISNITEDEKKNFENYSEIRGVQQYKIVFETLYKIDINVSYSDVNAFVIFDKDIKDSLFRFLGTLEEMIRNDILLRFDFSPDANLKDDEYHYFNKLPKCIKKNNPPDEITEFYKRFALNFGDLISFIREYDYERYDINKLEMVLDLRNDVMHHSPLLFNHSFSYTAESTLKKIMVLKELLPERYQQSLIWWIC